MSLYDGFFDAVLDEETGEYDRTYASGDFTAYFENIIGSGVCVHNDPDSFKVRFAGGAALVSPGYLFVRGYWLHNDADYSIPLTGTSTVAIAAHLNLGKRMVELTAVPAADEYPDSLVLALVDPSAGTAEDTRHNSDICGVILTAGELSQKVEWALNYIDTEIESKLDQVEKDIAAQDKLLDEKLAEAQNKIDSIEPLPVGSIKFSAAEDPGEGWLLCNGDFVNAETYPELVAAIGKHMPNVDSVSELAGGRYRGTFSTSFLKDGYLWVYWVEEIKLVGFKVDGTINDLPVEIALSTDGGFGFVPQTVQNPIVLSIVGGHIFLIQRTSLQTNAYAFYAVPYTSLLNTEPLTMMSIDVTSKIKSILVIISYNSNLNKYIGAIGQIIPEVVFLDGYFYVAAGGFARNYYTGSANYKYAIQYVYYFLKISQDLSNIEVRNHSVPTDGTRTTNVESMSYLELLNAIEVAYAGSHKRFSRKTSDEFFSVAISPSLDNGEGEIHAISFPNSVYAASVSIERYQNYLPDSNEGDPDFTSPVVSSKYYIQRAYIKDRKVFIRANTISPFFFYNVIQDGVNSNDQILSGITLSAYASVFTDSLEYISAHDLFVIFVGTGICFSRTPLDMDSWGYLDTTEYFGVITQFGGCEFDAERNILTLSGCNTLGDYIVGTLKIPEVYDYASEGAWLPEIAMDSVPAYIKASNDSRKAQLTITVLSPSSNFAKYFDVIFNKEVLIPGTHTRTVSPNGTLKIGIRLKNNGSGSSGYGKLKVNGTAVISLSTYNVSIYNIGYEKTITLKAADYISGGITLEGADY